MQPVNLYIKSITFPVCKVPEDYFWFKLRRRIQQQWILAGKFETSVFVICPKCECVVVYPTHAVR